MKLFSAVALLSVVLPVAAAVAEPPSGEWYNVDLRGFETQPGNACLRLWIEERMYNLQPAGERLTGTYRNVIRATPVGGPSFSPDCKYPTPATNPIASQVRLWSIVGKATDAGGWSIGAQPGMGGGDLQVWKTEEFKTILVSRGGQLIDGTGSPEDPDHALVFRRSAPPSSGARDILEATLTRLHGGACLEVLTPLAVSRNAAVEACALRQRMAQLAGRYLSLSMISATDFDRVPNTFPKAPSSGWKRQRGVFFEFTSRFERQQLLGNAIVFEEAGQWRVALLWF